MRSLARANPMVGCGRRPCKAPRADASKATKPPASDKPAITIPARAVFRYRRCELPITSTSSIAGKGSNGSGR